MSNTETSLVASLNEVYPIFEPNQLLTSTHLNQLRIYLDRQDRLSRVKLLGMGIVCGLEVSYSNHTITISAGTGITSEGFLAHMDQEEFTHCGEPSYLDPQNYAPFQDVGAVNGQIPMWELLPDDTEVTPLINFSNPDFVDFLNDKVVVLFVEYKDIDLENCVGENCDDKGKSRQFTLRKLLLNCSDVDAIIRDGYGIQYDWAPDNTLENNLNLRFVPDYAEMKAFSLIPDGTDVADFSTTYDGYTTTSSIQDRYMTLFPSTFSNPLRRLGDKIVEAYQYYSLWLKGTIVEGDIADLATKFDQQRDDLEAQGLLQYFYAYGKDIVRAYNEFIDLAFEITAECTPSLEKFPRHLVLGKVKDGAGCPETEDDCKPALYRTHFIQSPVYNQQKDKLKKAKTYFVRLVSMIVDLQPDFSIADPIKVTPSNEKENLLEKWSIPFYYRIDPLYKSWNYELSKRCKSHWNLGYWADQLTPVVNAVHNPLTYNKDPHNFYRIEGILGKNYMDVCEELKEERQRHQLDFNVLAIKLRKNSIDEIQAILAESENNCLRNVGCCDDHIKEDYIQLRNEIIAEVEKYNWVLSKMIYILGNFEEVLPNLMSGAAYGGAISPTFNSSSSGVPAVEANAGAILLALLPTIDQVDQLIATLPKCIDEFNLAAFKEALKGVQEMAFVATVLFERLLRRHVLLGPYLQYMIERFLLVNFGFIGSMYDLNDILRSNLDVQMSSLYFSYLQRLNASEESLLFSNFSQKNPGLYPMTGVPEGGTFVMVYDKDGEDETVVADFALHSKVCCETSFDHCKDPKAFPPTAKSVYYFIPDKADNTEKFQIDVLEFSLDVNVEDIFLVELSNDTSEEGCPIEIVDNTALNRKVVEYTLNLDTYDNGIDTFKYTIENESGKRDTGCVFIAKLPLGENFLMQAFANLSKGQDSPPPPPPLEDDNPGDATDITFTGPDVVISGADDTVIGVGDDYVLNDGGDYVVTWGDEMDHMEVAETHETLVPGRDNAAFELIKTTKDTYKKIKELGRLKENASAADRNKYEKLVVGEFRRSMKETADAIRSLDIQMGEEPTDLRKKLAYRLEFEDKIAEKNALVALYDNQSKALAEIVEKESLAKNENSFMFKFINKDVRSHVAKMGANGDKIKENFVRVAGRDNMNSNTIKLFNSFNINS